LVQAGEGGRRAVRVRRRQPAAVDTGRGQVRYGAAARSSGRLDVLLAAAVEADGASRLPAGGALPDLIAEIREGLKLYRYSGDGYERSLSGGGGDDRV